MAYSGMSSGGSSLEIRADQAAGAGGKKAGRKGGKKAGRKGGGKKGA